MKMPVRFLLSLAVLGAGLVPALAGSSDCGETLRPILQQAYPQAQEQGEGKALLVDGHLRLELPVEGSDSPHDVICKEWPAQPGVTLIAVPLIDIKKSGDGQNVGDLDILVVDAKSRTIRQRLRQDGLMSDDAVAIKAMSFDTADYRLNPGTIGFGLRQVTANQSQIFPFNNTAFWLYAVENGQLRVVLASLSVTSARGEVEDGCWARSETSDATLAMGRQLHKGYRDIVATLKESEERERAGKDGQCKTRSARHTTRVITLRYDGKSYPVPKALTF